MIESMCPKCGMNRALGAVCTNASCPVKGKPFTSEAAEERLSGHESEATQETERDLPDLPETDPEPGTGP